MKTMESLKKENRAVSIINKCFLSFESNTLVSPALLLKALFC